VENYPAAKRAESCIHCHEVNEYRREALMAEGKWNRDDIWVYPPPDNLGLTLEVDAGNRVQKAAPGSPAEKAGLRPGDIVQRLNDLPVASFLDAQYALNRAPAKGTIPVTWLRDGRPMSARLDLPEGWRKTVITWRPSMIDLLASLPLFGEDLTPERKKGLGLSEKRLAFEQDKTVHVSARQAGVRPGDIIIGINGEVRDMTMVELFIHVRRNYLVGDSITLNIIRDGKRLDLPLTLR
jgi:S1-C subfamily serine protease